jgi:U3 small nucleolar RNA-associated protein 18
MNRRQAKKAKVEAQSASVSEAARSALEAGQRSKSTKYRVRQREAAQQVKDSEERELEAFLFGGVEADAPMEEESDHEQHRPQPAKNVPVAAAASEDLFQIDTDGASAKKETAAVKSESKASSSGPAPAWVDEDDAGDQMVDLSSAARLRKLKSRAEERFITGKEYSKRLRQVYQEMNPGAESWAKESEPSDADLTQLLLQSTSNLTGAGTGVNGKLPGGAGRGEKLPSGSIELVRMKDANLVSPSQGVINSCKFHEGGQLMLTAGMDKMIRLFQIDGIENAKVQGVWLEDLPIISAEWLRSSSSSAPSAEIIASGRRTHFYSIDVASNKVTKVPNLKGREERSLEDMVVSPSGEYIAFLGNDGYILLVSGRTKQFIGSLKQNLNVASISFSADSSMIFSVGGEGIVYIWDVASRKCLYKHTDEGNIAGTAIAQDGGKGYYAVGSKSGAVNLYHTQQLSDRIASSSLATASASARLFASLTRPAPPPMKTFLNLTTPIDTLLFNCDSQLLLVGSRTTKDALKLVHVESQTVFANWPTSSTPLHFVSAVDFSPNSGYMSLANDRGRVLLYRLTHYPRA